MHKVTGLTKCEKGGSDAKKWSGSVRKETPLSEIPFVVFDTELSGLDPKKDFIVSIGAIKMSGSKIHVSREFYRLLKPEGDMSRKSVEIHGITPGELEKKESMETVLPDFLEFITDSVLVGHFINIDIDFINASLKKLNKGRLTNPAVDTHFLHDWLYKHGGEFKRHYRGASGKTDLFSISQKYGISVYTAHNALNDAFITAQLLQKFLHFLRPEGIRTLNDLLDIARA
ncbi:MAG: 3'-5' exonuclease [Nitrospiraceae bacterium]|nr:MAG: 3'-5' exonuclease [Nitrospiraceae bacterium]